MEHRSSMTHRCWLNFTDMYIIRDLFANKQSADNMQKCIKYLKESIYRDI